MANTAERDIAAPRDGGACARFAAIPEALSRHAAFEPYDSARQLVNAHVDRKGVGQIYPRLIAPPPRALGALEFEQRLVQHNELIVRDHNLHDTVNALVWYTFPHTKRAISEAHVALGAANTANGRPRRRDVLTLFDEAGALILSQRDDLRALHEAHEWKQLFVANRREFVRDCRVILFGHGTLEQIGSNPHRALTVKALWLPLANDASLHTIDSKLSQGVSTGEYLAESERRLALPILGVPGWFPESEDVGFYEDLSVFRGKRRT